MIREDDSTVEPDPRKELLREYGANADLVFSVHHNAANGKVEGAELLIQVRYESGGEGKEFSQIYQEKLDELGHTFRREVFQHSKDNPEKDYYFVLKSAAEVGCLGFISEFCFLDNSTDQQWVFGDDALDAEAETLCDVILTYFETHEY